MGEITIQVTEEAEREIESAARASGRSVLSFVNDAALSEARRVTAATRGRSFLRPLRPVVPRLRNALVIIRAWVQRGSSEPLRVSIRSRLDVPNGTDENRTTVTTPEAGAQAIKLFLEEVVEADRLDEQAEKTDQH